MLSSREKTDLFLNILLIAIFGYYVFYCYGFTHDKENWKEATNLILKGGLIFSIVIVIKSYFANAYCKKMMDALKNIIELNKNENLSDIDKKNKGNEIKEVYIKNAKKYYLDYMVALAITGWLFPINFIIPESKIPPLLMIADVFVAVSVGYMFMMRVSLKKILIDVHNSQK